MLKTTATVLMVSLALAACASHSPRVIQASSDASDIRLSKGLATQVEMRDEERVQSVAVGDPSLVSAEQSSDVVTLVAKGNAGETNLIIRARDEDHRIKVYQYHIIVQ
jgi:Flp pilus assembly secretin CpaC